MNKIQVLVVDDEETQREMLVDLGFNKTHHAVIQAINGKEAQKVIQRANPKIDIVVTDHDMPEMNGTELINWIKKHHSEIFVILTSGREIQHPLADHNVFKLDLLKKLPSLLKSYREMQKTMKQKPTE